MNWQIFAAVAALIALALLFKGLAWRGGKLSRHPYQKQTVLFSPDDRAFFRAIKEAVGGEYEIFGKIAVEEIIVPKNGDDPRAYAPIEGRVFDFVLLEKKSLAVACVIQLYDKTLPGGKKVDEHDLLSSICESLGLPLLRYHIQAEYGIDSMREKLLKAMAKEPFYLKETDGRKEPRISSLDDIEF